MTRRSHLTKSEERRGLTLSDARVEIRAAEGEEPRFFGHASVFSRRTAIGNPKTWGFFEEIAPGAFAKTITERDVAFLIDHSSAHIVARTSAGDLHLHEDEIGLATDADLDLELSYVRDLRRNLEKRRITGMSFGFYVPDGKDDWTTETVRAANGEEYTAEVRTIREVQLVEVSAVTFPAYQETDAAVRALRSRGDVDAIARRAEFRPELAVLLDEVAPKRSTVIPVVTPAMLSDAGAIRPDSSGVTVRGNVVSGSSGSPHLRRIASRVNRTAARLVDFATRNETPVSALPAARLPWFQVRADAPADGTDGGGDVAATVLLFDEIGGSFGVDATALVEEINAITADRINLRINSPGGSVFDALAIQNALRHHPATVTAFVDGLAASAASVVAMGADEVVMMPGAQMMIHDASAMSDGNAADMAKMATFLERQSDNIASLYARKGGGDTGEWRNLMRSETWMFDHEAVSLGLADRVDPVCKTDLDPETEEALTRSFDLSGFRYEGRTAAPAPEQRRATPEQAGPADATPDVTEDVEPGESTPDASGQTDSTDSSDEPGESTRGDEFAPSETAVRRARMTLLASRYGLPRTA